MAEYTIGEPTEIPAVGSRETWHLLFSELSQRLAKAEGQAIPVQLENPTRAILCRMALYNSRLPSRRTRYVDRFPGLQATQRGDTVFFWLKMGE